MRSELLAVSLALSAGSCIAPSVVSSSGRSVSSTAPSDWRPAAPADLAGLFESVAVEGPDAQALARVLYHFTLDADVDAAGGVYTGAALVIGDGAPQFQTLGGVWRVLAGRLELDGVDAAGVQVAGEWLRLESESGAIVLRKAALL